MVPYGELMDGIRNLQNRQEKGIGPLLKKGGLGLFSQPMLLRMGARFLHAFPRHKLSILVQLFKNNRIKRFVRLLPEVAAPIAWQTLYPADGIARKQVGLFLGCVSRVSDQAVLQATVSVLNKLGQDVVVPPDQVCCGALHLHGGEPEAVKKLTALNQVAFGSQPLEAIISIASGCSAHLKEHSLLPTPVQDVCAYLDTLVWPGDAVLRPLRCRVAVHDPCSLRNILKAENAVYRLLRKIPEIELIPLPGNELCCGAGGINLLTQPQMADALLDLKLASLRACRPDILLTSNTSCSLHLAAGIRAAGLDIELLHPVELLSRQLEDASEG